MTFTEGQDFWTGYDNFLDSIARIGDDERTIAIQFETDNAAFEDDPAEVRWILHEIAARIQSGDTIGQIRDINGNTAGDYCFKEA